MKTAAFFLCSVLAVVPAAYAQSAGSHTDLNRWCGKPYESGSPNYDPGGQTYPPSPSSSQLLYVQVVPRHSIYVDSETTGTFIVDATLSHTYGDAYYNSTYITGSNGTNPFTSLYFSIALESNDKVLVQNNVLVNSTDNLFEFDLTQLEASMDAYNIVLYGASEDGNQTYTATTQLFYLPDKTTGSVTKIDNLYGGMLFKNNATGYEFQPLLAFGFYTSYGGYLELSLDNVQAYADMGFNTIHPIPTFSPNLSTIFDYADQINLLWQYDMRNTYQNLTSVAEQVSEVMDHSSLFAYYTADEPDGWEYPLNSTLLAYETITSLDKYHPVGLVLNCQNFYYGEYSSGADYVMEDAYPIGINATYSGPWGTPCNITYGDCGCDNCEGSVMDVSSRLDDLSNYQSWLGQWSKPLWAVPQSFSGEGYWSRDPTVAETYVMNQLAFNHKAKSIMIWDYPTASELAAANAAQAKVVTVSPVLEFLVGAHPVPIVVDAYPLLDVAFWIVDTGVLVSVVNLDYVDTTTNVAITLPFAGNGSTIVGQPWGDVQWSLTGTSLEASGLSALATSFVILQL
ncbi:hypothetical protein BP5796_04036 [Coleophoma crateriformis]|uniref:Glycoside hydrolase family 30 protein n=1 Tax=Coleophoma crateriformis TaxID=565419 RepID=A0A3D8SHR5_9HELO|nr:hypothetical protein BP5796_04036 [Coleophoma crateriformis]